MTQEAKPAALERRQAAFSLQPQTLGEAIEFAKLIAGSELCPREYHGKPQSVLIAVQMGAELGIAPLQALQNIAVINGRPVMWGDLLLGLVQSSGQLEAIRERDPQECLKMAEGECKLLRKGKPDAVVRTYSMEMAERAGLTKRGGPTSPWATHPGRMLQMRARAWALRDAFADVLKGLQAREEVEDYPPDAPPIQMPRRLSDPAPEVEQQVQSFLTAIEPESKDPAPKSEPWIGFVKEVRERSGRTAGKPWILFTVVGRDEIEFGTFSADHAAFARDAGQSSVQIAWEYTAKGGRKILDIGPAEL